MEISSTFIYVSLTLWQIGIIIYILLNKFYEKNPKKIYKTIPTQKAVEVKSPKKKAKHIDVEMKKQILMDKTSKSNIVSDEVIKGKVTTQKDKLKKLRRGL